MSTQRHKSVTLDEAGGQFIAELLRHFHQDPCDAQEDLEKKPLAVNKTEGPMNAKEVAQSLLADFEDEEEAGELIAMSKLTVADSPYRIGDTCLARLVTPGMRHIIMSGEIIQILPGHGLAYLVQPYVPGWEPIVAGIRDIVLMGFRD